MLFLENEIAEDRGSGNASGEIYLANESRFVGSTYSEPLTTYTQGWKDPDGLDAILDTIAPRVDVGRRFEYKKFDNAEEFVRDVKDDRAIGSTFKRIEFSGTSASDKTHNRGLTIRIDNDEQYGPNWEAAATAKIMRRLTRNEVFRALALLVAAGTNAAKTWGSSANPDADIRAAVKLYADATGIQPDTVLMAEAAAHLRLDAYEAQATAGAFAGAQRSMQSLAAYLMVDRVDVMKHRYQSAAAAKTSLMGGNYVLIFLAPQGVDTEDPSNIKRFVTPVGGAGRYRVYREEHDKYVDISVEHYSNIVLPTTLGIRKLTIS